jgi:hypothetical protein
MEMKELTVKGLVTVEGMKFHEIEGGFGEGKKSMLAKEIAEIHNKKPYHINEAINNNRKRFVDMVDIIDLKGTEVAIDLVESEIYSKNAVNASKNIYLLSERGYAKLLKILDDDIAWEQYDKLVDGYFAMRKVIKENSLEAKVMNELSEMREEYVSSCEEIVDAFYDVKGDINLIHQTLNMMAEGFKTMNSTIATLASIQQQPRVMPKRNRDTSTVTDIAKELRIKPKEVNDILEKEHIIERRNNSIYARPTVQKSWYRNNQYRDGNKVTYYITYTEEGREGVIKIIKKHLPEQMKF